MTTLTNRDLMTIPTGPDVPVANRCLPARTSGWSCQVWNSGRKVISRALGAPRGELTRPQQLAVQAIQAVHAYQDPSLLLVALHVTAHDPREQVSGEALAEAVSELAAMSEEGTLTGFRIQFPAQEQIAAA